MRKFDVYMFKYRFIWICWVLAYTPNEPIPYNSDVKTVEIHSEHSVKHLIFGFSREGVIRRITKHVKKKCGVRRGYINERP